MGFTSIDDLIAQLSSGKVRRVDHAKTITPGHTAGGWHLLAGLPGFPNATTFPGTDLLWASCDEAVGDGTTLFGIPAGDAPGGAATKHILNVGAGVVAAAGAPWQAKLVDLQGYYRLSGANVTGTGSRSLINSNTFTASDSGGDLLLTYTNDLRNLTRVRVSNSGGALPGNLAAGTDYWLVRQSATTAKVATSRANALAGPFVAWSNAGSGTHTLRMVTPRYTNGEGCEAFFVVQTAPTGGGPNLSASAYDAPTDFSGTGTRAFQGSPTNGAAADAYATRILHSGNAAGRFGAFLPRQGADAGVARINSFTFSGGTAYTGSGVLALCIARPLLDILLPATGVWSERDLVNQLPSLPRVHDGACLAWMLFGTGATSVSSPFTAALDLGWGG
jgi:hypothetical protein